MGAVRTAYHHGDLANALVAVGLRLAGEGGPQAVRLRQAAREVGVTATAAYRHFASRDGLLDAVRDSARAALAEAMARARADQPVVDAATEVRVLASGYVRFALTEPGLFRTATDRLDECAEPLRMLADAVERLAGSGTDATHTVWASVHGSAVLLADQSLSGLAAPVRQSLVDKMLDVVLAGISSTGHQAVGSEAVGSEAVGRDGAAA